VSEAYVSKERPEHEERTRALILAATLALAAAACAVPEDDGMTAPNKADAKSKAGQ
jgi:hypothetical protein